MIIEHFGGREICINDAQLYNVLNFKTEKGVNEFWISKEDNYPTLVLLVNNELAYIHFFVEEGEPGFQILSDEKLLLDRDGVTTFYTNTEIEEVKVPNSSVISFQRALLIVREFFETNAMPNCIKWEEL